MASSMHLLLLFWFGEKRALRIVNREFRRDRSNRPIPSRPQRLRRRSEYDPVEHPQGRVFGRWAVQPHHVRDFLLLLVVESAESAVDSVVESVVHQSDLSLPLRHDAYQFQAVVLLFEV